MTRLYFDTETQLIIPGCTAPPMSCMSACVDDGPGVLLHWTEAYTYVLPYLQHDYLVGANLGFDMAVLAANFPTLLPLIFAAYDAGRCHDVLIRQKLLDIACGVYRGYLNNKWVWVQFNYNLEAVTRRHSDMRLNKDPAIRLTYGELRDVPLALWPASHTTYATEDALATRECFLGQERALAKNPGVDLLGDEPRQCAYDFALRLMSAWGMRTDPQRVDELERVTEAEYERLKALLVEEGLVRGAAAKKQEGTRDTKAAKARMMVACGFQRSVDGASFEPIKGLPQRKMHLTEGGQKGIPDVSLAAEACRECEDPVLELYGAFGEMSAVFKKDVKLLRGGVTFPLHTRFDIAASGRETSSNPNIQNLRRLPGIREAFRPREGWVYAQADVEGLELATLAQGCIDIVGYSRLGEAINNGIDPHTDLASAILFISYDEAKRRKKLGDTPGVKLLLAVETTLAREPLRHEVCCTDEEWRDYRFYTEFVNARQTAKVANFGFPGGLGIKKMVLFAKATYNVVISEEECARLKERWLTKWPEMQEYFAWINKQMQDDGTATIVQLRSGRIRGGCSYCAAANTIFQGLGADATKSAAWALCKECYNDRQSVMYGSRPCNYVHDEFIVETLDTPAAHDVATRLESIMVSAIQPWTPDIRIAAPPLLMRYWSKNAKAVYDANKRLVPWS